MTNQEASKVIKDGIEDISLDYFDEEQYEALTMAIKALEQEPCDKYIKAIDHLRKYIYKLETQIVEQEPMREFTEEETKAYSKALDKMYKPTGFNVFDEPSGDLISRQTVLDGIEELNAISFYEAQEDSMECYREIKQMIKQLTPVKQEPKEGHWNIIGHNCIKCNQCGFERDYYNQSNYCPHCGARMESEESDADSD